MPSSPRPRTTSRSRPTPSDLPTSSPDGSSSLLTPRCGGWRHPTTRHAWVAASDGETAAGHVTCRHPPPPPRLGGGTRHRAGPGWRHPSSKRQQGMSPAAIRRHRRAWVAAPDNAPRLGGGIRQRAGPGWRHPTSKRQQGMSPAAIHRHRCAWVAAPDNAPRLGGGTRHRRAWVAATDNAPRLGGGTRQRGALGWRHPTSRRQQGMSPAAIHRHRCAWAAAPDNAPRLGWRHPTPRRAWVAAPDTAPRLGGGIRRRDGSRACHLPPSTATADPDTASDGRLEMPPCRRPSTCRHQNPTGGAGLELRHCREARLESRLWFPASA